MPSINVVLDSSAALAWLFREPGYELVQEKLETKPCHISSVNLAEMVTLGSRISAEHAAAMMDFVHGMNVTIQSYDAEQALRTGLLDSSTRHKGLSLGDRACLVLARKLNAEVLAADSAWLDLDLDISITNIRAAS